jgi:hypothetical protein
MRGRLPNFLIAGAPRCGTTSLALWLGEHPEVFVSTPKELHFFNRTEYWERGPEWYAQQFAGAGDVPAAGEGTPNYLLLPHAIERIATTLPGVRIIACLREPVSRAYSTWHLHRAIGIEARPFEVAIEQELAASRDPLEQPWRTHADTPGIGMDYVARGDYLPQLERAAAVFGADEFALTLGETVDRGLILGSLLDLLSG